MAQHAIAIGIDLGTSNSVVSAIVDGKPVVIANGSGEKIHASVVSFTDDNRIIVGNEAKRRLAHNPKRTVFSAKRLIGRNYYSSEVKKARAIAPYEITEGPTGDVRICIGAHDYTLPEVSAFVLEEMKRIAEQHFDCQIQNAVITVPAYFNDTQRQATRDAGRIAGLNVLRILNEPTAAALAYGFGRDLDQRVAIYDLGGGTFDISILQLGGGVYEVLATAGDTFLGGDDIDDRLSDFIAEQFAETHGIDIRANRLALQQLKAISERAKIALSYQPNTTIDLSNLTDESGKPYHFQISITRQQLRELCYDLIQRTFQVCDEALRGAKCSASDMEGVVLVGGSTHIPLVQDMVKDYFSREPLRGINPEEVVGIGAAIQADALMTSDESHESKALLIDVTPLTLGIETAGGIVERLISRNTPIPVEQTRVFSTTKDDQTEAKIRIFQGESRRIEENQQLGELILRGLPSAAKGRVQIEVTFEINTDGIVNVSAKDLATGNRQTIEVHVSGGLTSAELQRLVAQHAVKAAS